MLEHTLNQLQVVYVGVPNCRRTVQHLGLDFLGAIIGRPTGGEGGPATAGEVGVPHRIRVSHAGMNVFRRDAQNLGGVHGDGHPGPSDVGRAGNQADGAVGVHRYRAAGLQADVEPESRGHAPGSPRTANGRFVLFRVFSCFQALDIAYSGKHRSVHPAGAFFRGVNQPELYGVYVQLLTDFINHLFASKGSAGSGWRPVSRRLRFIYHHVKSVNLDVFYVVVGENAHRPGAHQSTGITAGFIGQIALCGGNLTFLCGAHLDLDVGPGSGSGALKGFDPAHQHLHGVPRLFGEQRRQWLQIDGYFPAEPATDFHGHHLDLGNRHVQYRGQCVPGAKCPLGAAPDRHVAVLVPHCGGIMGLNVTLVHHGRGEFPLHDHIGFSKALFRVSQLVPQVDRNVALFISPFAQLLGGLILVQ